MALEEVGCQRPLAWWQHLYELIETQSAHYGSLIRARFGEPFFAHETMRVEDVVALEAQSM